MKFLNLILFFLIANTLVSQKSSSAYLIPEAKEGSYLGYKYIQVIPSNLEECLISLNCMQDDILKAFSDLPIEDALKNGFNNNSNRLRMNWKLEIENTKLHIYFNHAGVCHYKTMITIILWKLHNKLNNISMKEKKIFQKSKKIHKIDEKAAKLRMKKRLKEKKKPATSYQLKENLKTPTTFEEWIFSL